MINGKTQLSALSDTEIGQLAAQLRSYSVHLYSQIIQFQARLVVRYDRSPVSRYVRDVVKRDDWEGILESIKRLEASNEKDISVRHKSSQRELGKGTYANTSGRQSATTFFWRWENASKGWN
jgi:hypothetical protein